jgi:hypothetical protein
MNWSPVWEELILLLKIIPLVVVVVGLTILVVAFVLAPLPTVWAIIGGAIWIIIICAGIIIVAHWMAEKGWV